MIETDGVALCVHYRRLTKDRSVPPSASPVAKDAENKAADPATQQVEDNDLVVGTAKHEDEKEAGLETQKVQDNDFVVGAAKHKDEKEAGLETQKVQDNDFIVGADPGNTNIVTIAASTPGEDDTDGDLRQRDMRLLRFPTTRCYRESGMMNARKRIEIWNAGVKEHLEALSEVTSRGTDFRAFREFLQVRVAHWDALWRSIQSLGGLVCE
jgi:hypothetical protein